MAPNAPKKPIEPNRKYDDTYIAAVSYRVFSECPGAPKPARGEMEPIYGLDAVACQLFPDIHGAPRKPAVAPVQDRTIKCNACRRLDFDKL